MQDVEFTVQRGKVWMLQTRNAKRTGFAAVRIAVDLVNEGVIAEEEALNPKRIPADDLNQLLQPIYDPESKRAAVNAGRLLAKGINAGPGAASGKICFHASDAEAEWLKDNNVKLILVRRETSPEDLRGMKIAQGILTAFGGASSHAALVSRQMGKACIVGCGELNIDYNASTVTVKGKVLKAGDSISIDGFTGEVFDGAVETRPSEILQVLITKTLAPEKAEVYQRYEQLMSWVDNHRRLARADQCRRAEASPRGGRLRCRRDRPVPHRAHVLRPHRRFPRDDPGHHARRARKGPGQAAALPARRFRRHLPGHGRPAGHHPPAGSAAARVLAPHARGTSRPWPARSAFRPKRSPAASTSCTSSTPCSATAAAAWASSIPKSRGCKPGPSSKPLAT